MEQVKWTYNHDTQTVTNGTLTLNIGDYVNDTETTVTGFDGKWRILGEENGQLLLVTSTFWAPFEGSVGSPTMPMLSLSGVDGWNNGIKKLNDIGATYNSSKLENGRSIKIEDVNKITGYNPNNTGINDPNQTGIGIPYRSGNIEQYNNKVTYTLKNGKVWYKGDKAITTETESTTTTFKVLGENSDITEPYTIENDYYEYYATTLTETNDNSANVGISNSSVAFDMLFNIQGPPYYFASRCTTYKDDAYGNGRADWGFRVAVYSRKC